jgi:hypothetical protein
MLDCQLAADFASALDVASRKSESMVHYLRARRAGDLRMKRFHRSRHFRGSL